MIDSSTNKKHADASRIWTKRLVRALAMEVLFFAVVLFVSHWVWKFSGSNQWKLVIDRNGAKVYSLKEPGSSLEKFKGIVRVKTTMNRVVSALMDNSVENCADWIPGCVISKLIVPWNPQDLTFTGFWREDFPSPFRPRELVLRGQFSHLPDTKAINLQFIEMPGLIPRNDCCIRVTHMRNNWLITPLKDGEVEAQLVDDIDTQVPYVLVNRMGAEGIYEFLEDLPRLFNKDKYANMKWDFID